jgi:hypothetical protein
MESEQPVEQHLSSVDVESECGIMKRPKFRRLLLAVRAFIGKQRKLSCSFLFLFLRPSLFYFTQLGWRSELISHFRFS